MSNTGISCNSIAVKFGDFTALDSVTVEFDRGKIHALVGQNGAGKTTLARVIAGLIAPHAGTVAVEGRYLDNGDVISARSAGVEMVHQSFTLPPSMTVAEALEFGSTKPKGKLFSRAGLNNRWQKYLDQLDIHVDASQRLSALPVETLQSIEIARALSGDAKILILDEPTAVLPPESIDRLFHQIRSLRDSGVTVIIVLHKVREVLQIAETVTVLRKGQLIMAGVSAKDLQPESLAEAIIGPALSAELSANKKKSGDSNHTPASTGERSHDAPLVRLRDVSSREGEGGPGLKNVTFSMGKHEIVGVAGVEGNGQVALAKVITGMSAVNNGQLEIASVPANQLSSLARRALGLRIIPFERNTEGVSGSSALWQNWSIPLIAGGRRGNWGLSPARLRKLAEASLQEWGVSFNSINQKAGELSGGNIQKLILARELDENAKIIIAAQPTRGLDLGAVSFVWSALSRAKESGGAVLVISSDLDELIDISDRIIVMLDGQIALDCTRPFDQSEIGRAMTGVKV